MDELIDDVGMLQRFFSEALPGVTVARELDERASSKLPMLLYDTTGSSDEAVVNGPGLWDIGLVVSVLAWSEQGAHDLARSVDALVMSWDLPGNGWLPGEGGVTRASREQKFDHVYEADIYGKDARQADATYRLRMRNL